MNLATATLLVNGITALLTALPGIIESIRGMDAPEEDKDALIARVRAAQASLPEWK